MEGKSSLTIVNSHLKFGKVSLTNPINNVYLHIAAEIDHSPFPFFLTSSNKKKKLIKQCKQWCFQLEKENKALSARVFKATLIPPGKGKFIEKRKDKIYNAKFDFAILIEVKTAAEIIEIQESEAYKKIELAIKSASAFTQTITATNIKRINRVDDHKQGVFLFNYFFADSVDQNLEVWEYTAGWFQQETGLDNSAVLLPACHIKPGYSIINHCRWNKLSDVLPSLIFKRSFHSYVLANFFANNVAAMPVLYKMA